MKNIKTFINKHTKLAFIADCCDIFCLTAGNLFRKLRHDARGAVTVLITLLLIPAILVSGTAVDLARLHSARSVLQDANQLAANSVLTQYNALLQDLYGIYGVAQNDPILGRLLDDYISVAVFGETTQDRSLGTLQLFYGSDIQMEDLGIGTDMNLENPDVLRRQIEEYMKFRGPVIIVQEILDAIGSNNLSADSEIIQKKTAIDAAIAELYDKYKELYDAIVAADKIKLPIGGISGSHFGTISAHLKRIREEFIALKNCYTAWESLELPQPTDEEEELDSATIAEFERIIDDYAAKYEAIMINIRNYVIGGRRGSNWSNGHWGSYGSGDTGLNSLIENAKENGENFKEKFDIVLQIARELDEMNAELSRKIDDLERKLNDGTCSEELRNGLTERTGNPPMSMIERYRDILKWDDITSMANVYKNGGYNYIDDEYKPMLDDLRYRNSASPTTANLTLDELANLTSNSAFALSESMSSAYSRCAFFASFPENNVTYHMPDGFLKFAEHPGDNREFYEVLEAMMNQPELSPVKLDETQEDAGGSNAQQRQRNLINAILEMIESAYIGLTNNPLGAMRIEDSATPDPERLGILQVARMIPEALASPIMSIVSDPLGSLSNVGDYILLLTYCTSMFSNYTTTRPDSIGKTRDNLDEIDFPDSITGVPISPRVNYFFQSEWEYLYHGSKSASDNLSSVTRLLFTIRLICNYITVFSVSDVTSIVTSIQGAFAWMPPLGIVLGELARAAFAAAETLVDIAALRTGHKVPIMKNASNGEWTCSPSGLINVLNEITTTEETGGAANDNERGLTYSNYMLFFFLMRALFYVGSHGSAAEELAVRAGDLIEWNAINYLSNANADEAQMTTALGNTSRLRLVDMITGFRITTTVNMRMLFLSMPLAQSGVARIIPPEFLALSATDYRGY